MRQGQPLIHKIGQWEGEKKGNRNIGAAHLTRRREAEKKPIQGMCGKDRCSLKRVSGEDKIQKPNPEKMRSKQVV